MAEFTDITREDVVTKCPTRALEFYKKRGWSVVTSDDSDAGTQPDGDPVAPAAGELVVDGTLPAGELGAGSEVPPLDGPKTTDGGSLPEGENATASVSAESESKAVRGRGSR
ncbi:hypothetical protein [Aeromicrobium sp. Leaf291]|uniref:hypothetical protein n=1 Tax=Aeromicrobium sp. Leaf291 TaxID=1736325 RepID=UPI0006F82C80|nr:hypothetical protein [Aeromicrobium sp. Leaf291]KQP81572.1 hypothetical protein ASF35_16205 [Aeromicrobium sp. Leaf291]